MTNQKIYYELAIRNNKPQREEDVDGLTGLMDSLAKDAFLAGYSDRKLSQREVFATVSRIYGRLQIEGTNDERTVRQIAEEEFVRSGIEPKRVTQHYDFIDADDDLGFPVEISSSERSPTGEREIYRKINVNRDGKLGFGYINVGVEVFELDSSGSIVKRSVELHEDSPTFMDENNLDLDDYLLKVDPELQQYKTIDRSFYK